MLAFSYLLIEKFHAQVSWAWKKFYDLGARRDTSDTETRVTLLDGDHFKNQKTCFSYFFLYEETSFKKKELKTKEKFPVCKNYVTLQNGKQIFLLGVLIQLKCQYGSRAT